MLSKNIILNYIDHYNYPKDMNKLDWEKYIFKLFENLKSKPNGLIIYNRLHYFLNTKNLISTIDNNSVCYRSFNIKCFLSHCDFETVNIGVPNILQYDIYMSSNPIMQACSPAIATPKSGLNVCAIGTPENYNLNNILPTYFTLLRNSSAEYCFNYLSLVSPSSNLVVSYIIEDYLS